MNAERWEDELIKMKMCGINMVATYVFWIHHEEEEGIFDFSGSRDIRRFVELCKRHGLYVILRVGPFDHGEVRNGGLPDWLYGKPFEVRKISEGFLDYTKRLYCFLRTAGRLSGCRLTMNICIPPRPGRLPREFPTSGCLQGMKGRNICCS